jgi:hypothetical protein
LRFRKWISGRWYYNSGSWHADWAVLGAPLSDNGEVIDQALVLVPRADLSIEETWFVAGMKDARPEICDSHRTRARRCPATGDAHVRTPAPGRLPPSCA